MKLKKYIVLDSDDTPIPPKSMLCVCMIALGPLQSNLRYLNFLKKNEKIKFLKKNLNVSFLPPPLPPWSMLDIIWSPGHPLTNIDYGGRGFPIFWACPKYYAHDCLSFCSKTDILLSLYKVFWCSDEVQIWYIHGQSPWKQHLMRWITWLHPDPQLSHGGSLPLWALCSCIINPL